MTTQNSKTGDLNTLFSMIGRYGPTMALGFIAMLSMWAAFIIYKTMKGQRKTDAGDPGKTEAEMLNPNGDAIKDQKEETSSGAESSDDSDEGISEPLENSLEPCEATPTNDDAAPCARAANSARTYALRLNCDGEDRVEPLSPVQDGVGSLDDFSSQRSVEVQENDSLPLLKSDNAEVGCVERGNSPCAGEPADELADVLEVAGGLKMVAGGGTLDGSCHWEDLKDKVMPEASAVNGPENDDGLLIDNGDSGLREPGLEGLQVVEEESSEIQTAKCEVQCWVTREADLAEAMADDLKKLSVDARNASQRPDAVADLSSREHLEGPLDNMHIFPVDAIESVARLTTSSAEGSLDERANESCAPTEISIMEATMEHNEWLIAGVEEEAVISLGVELPAEAQPTAQALPTEALANGATRRAVAEVQPMPQTVRVCFSLHYVTQSPCQLLAVTGSRPELGSWGSFIPLRPAKGVDATTGVWAAAISLPAESQAEWKFVLVEDGEVRRWEECPNRRLETGREEEVRLDKMWGLL